LSDIVLLLAKPFIPASMESARRVSASRYSGGPHSVNQTQQFVALVGGNLTAPQQSCYGGPKPLTPHQKDRSNHVIETAIARIKI
jgi:hypothetical protein